MLTIFNILKKNKISRTYNQQGQSVNTHKRNIPFNKEWYNSVYSFDKNSMRFLPSVHDYTFRLLKGYFNMVSEKMEADVTSKKYKKLRRTSGKKVWIGTPEIKHLSDRLTITVYIYNRVYNLYRDKLELLESTWGPLILEKEKYYNADPSNEIIVQNTEVIDVEDVEVNNTETVNIVDTHKHTHLYTTKPRFYSTNSTSLTKKQKLVKASELEHTENIPSKKASFYTDLINWLKSDIYNITMQHKSAINTNKINLADELSLLKLERYNYLITFFRKELIYFKFKQKLLYNQFKLSELYITPLLKFLQTIYKKKVELNIIVLKNYYLNSSILLQIIETKLKKAKARGRHLKTVDRAMSRIKIPTLSANKLQRLEKKTVDMQNVILDNYKAETSKDSLNQLLMINNPTPKKDIHKLILKNLENKSISGLFIKISGRLTKRYKAQRAVSTLRAKGTLKNVHSAHTGFSSTLARGYSNINVEKTMLHSKNRIGAYGLTGWIASH